MSRRPQQIGSSHASGTSAQTRSRCSRARAARSFRERCRRLTGHPPYLQGDPTSRPPTVYVRRHSWHDLDGLKLFANSAQANRDGCGTLRPSLLRSRLRRVLPATIASACDLLDSCPRSPASKRDAGDPSVYSRPSPGPADSLEIAGAGRAVRQVNATLCAIRYSQVRTLASPRKPGRARQTAKKMS